MTSPDPSWRVGVASASRLGERPVWDANAGSLVWVDVTAALVHRSTPSRDPGGLWDDVCIPLGEVVGAVALCRSGGVIAAVDSTIRFLDIEGRDLRAGIPIDMPEGHRFNDGACDPAGRFLIGSAGSTASGLLWSVGPDARATVVLDGLTESNGLGWSEDGSIMYFIDSCEGVVRRYAYDLSTGRVSMRLTDLVDLTSRPGAPDGLVIDAVGRLWVPQWQGGELACFDASGAVVERWSLPVSQPTCAGFAGPDLETLVLATSWEDLPPDRLAREPWAGHLLVCDAAVPGRSPDVFAG